MAKKRKQRDRVEINKRRDQRKKLWEEHLEEYCKRTGREKEKASNSELYFDFIKSKYWGEVRKKVLIRDKRKCTKCGAKRFLHIHHKSYRNHYNEHEHLEDLITLCRECHGEVHKLIDKKAKKKPNPKKIKKKKVKKPDQYWKKLNSENKKKKERVRDKIKIAEEDVINRRNSRRVI